MEADKDPTDHITRSLANCNAILADPESYGYAVTHLTPVRNSGIPYLVGLFATVPFLDSQSEALLIHAPLGEVYCKTRLESALVAVNGDSNALEQLKQQPGTEVKSYYDQSEACYSFTRKTARNGSFFII